MIKTNSKEYKQAVHKYLIDCIDLSNYSEYMESNDPRYLINSVYEIFVKEYGYMIDRQGEQRALAEWFSGLPGCINIEYRHYEMIEIAKQLHGVDKLTEKQKDAIIGNWFNYMAFRFLQYKRELNKVTDRTIKDVVESVTRTTNDVNGNPRYIVSWISLGLDSYKATDKTRKAGLTKYRGKSYGGGFVFTSYNLESDISFILETLKN